MHRFVLLSAVALSPVAAGTMAAALVALGVGALVRRRKRLSGSTLAAVWVWSLVSLAAIGVAELLVALAGGEPASPSSHAMRFSAAVSSICPIMALLGAKRPQDRGWQFIVFTLWVILSLPAAHWLLFGGVREIHPAQVGLLAILIGAGAINAMATRQLARRFALCSWASCFARTIFDVARTVAWRTARPVHRIGARGHVLVALGPQPRTIERPVRSGSRVAGFPQRFWSSVGIARDGADECFVRHVRLAGHAHLAGFRSREERPAPPSCRRSSKTACARCCGDSSHPSGSTSGCATQGIRRNASAVHRALALRAQLP